MEENSQTISKRKHRQRVKLIVMIASAFLLGILIGKIIGNSNPETKTKGPDVVYAENKETIDILEEDTTEQEEPSTEELTEKEKTEPDYKIPAGLDRDEIEKLVIEKPVDYSFYQAVAKLEELAAVDERYAAIVAQKEIYPEKLLINLVNNPELLSFVSGYPADAPADKTITEEELSQKCPLFLQWDKRWGYLAYGDNSNISISGCGPTALSMVVVGLTGNAEATPGAIADFAMHNGYFMSGTGTMWKLMTDGAAHYGLISEQIDVEQELIDQCLQKDGMVICSMSAGDFTAVGHFIVIYGSDEEGYIINDPFCVYRSNQKWSFEQLKKQMKAAWTLFY